MKTVEEVYKPLINWKVINIIIDKCTKVEDAGGTVSINVKAKISNHTTLTVWDNKYGFDHYGGYGYKIATLTEDGAKYELIYSFYFSDIVIKKIDQFLIDKIRSLISKFDIDVITHYGYEFAFTIYDNKKK